MSCTTPFEIPVTIPELVTVAMVGLLLVQTPPEDGSTLVVKPTQIVDGPERLTVGGKLTVIGAEANEIQPVDVSVK